MTYLLRDKIICLVIGYLFGNILLGYILGRMSDVDIRSEGSGNVGTTNATRVLGKKKGFITLLCDVGKGLFAALAAWLIYHDRGNGMMPEDVRMLMVFASFGAVLGHDFPFYMRFKGGKGVATSLAFLGVVNPKVLPPAVLVFVITVAITKYVSLGSILATVFSVMALFGFGGLKYYPLGTIRYEIMLLVLLAASFLVIRHHENIGRLIRGEESKFSLNKRKGD